MERVEVEAFATPINGWIVRTPGRTFPAVVVQGDSFSALFSLAQSILDRLRRTPPEDHEALEEAEELRDLLWARLQHYEVVLAENGIDLPYVLPKRPA